MNPSPLTFFPPSHHLENSQLLSQFSTFRIVQQFGLLTLFCLCSIFPLKCCPQLHKRYPYFTCQVPASQQMPSCPITNDDYTRGHCQRLTVIALTQEKMLIKALHLCITNFLLISPVIPLYICKTKASINLLTAKLISHHQKGFQSVYAPVTVHFCRMRYFTPAIQQVASFSF